MIKLSELKKLHEKGFSLIYLKPKSKRPLENKWTSRESKSWEEFEAGFNSSYNVGVRLGASSKLITGNYLACVDCDVKVNNRQAKSEMNNALRELGLDLNSAPTVVSGRGNGSKHIYVQTAEPLIPRKFRQSTRIVKVHMPSEKLGSSRGPSKAELGALTPAEIASGWRLRPAWEISLMGTGQQTVLPGSTHPDTGGVYVWGNPFSVKYLPVFKPPAASNSGKIDKETMKEIAGDFHAVDVDLSATRLSPHYIKTIEEGFPKGEWSEGVFGLTLSMCRAGMSDNEILSVLSNPDFGISRGVYERRQGRHSAIQWLTKYVLSKARYETDPMRLFEGKPDNLKPLSPERAEKVGEQIEMDHDWKMDLQRTEKGGFRLTLRNVELILSNVTDPGVFIHNSFSTRDSYGMNTSWGGKTGQELTDLDLIKIRHWLSSSHFKIEPSRDLVLEAVRLIADRNQIHPVRQWLKSLEWDGVPRIDSWMKKHLRAQGPEPYLSEVSRTFLLAMIKRVFEPGCQWDYTLVLEGKQGTYKSTTARVLAGDEWFMDNLPDLHDKDAMLNLQGKWIIELGELTSIKKSDYNNVKAYLNRRVDRVRSPYGRLPQDTPRQSVFIGTVNEGQYLKDPTGNRRFWPVRVEMCDVEGLRETRTQLFAEAYYIFENFFDGKLMLGERATQQAMNAQEKRRVYDEASQMEDMFFEFFEKEMQKKESEKAFDFYRFKIAELFTPFGPWGAWENMPYALQNGANVLHKLNFIHKRVGGRWFWKWPKGVPLNAEKW